MRGTKVFATLPIVCAAAIAAAASAQTPAAEAPNGPQAQHFPGAPPPARPPTMRPPPPGRTRLTLFTRPDFRGRTITLTHSTPDLTVAGFGARTNSLHAHGRWRVCDLAFYRGRCVTVQGSRPTLPGATSRIASARRES